MLSASPMQLRYTASTLWLFVLIGLAGLPALALAQDDDGLGDDGSSDTSGDDGSLGSDDDEFADSEPTLDEDDEFADSEPTLDEDELAADGSDSGRFEDELPVDKKAPFAGRLQIALTGGFGLRLAGDKTLNLFGEGRREEVNEIDYGAPVDPNAMAVAEPLWSAFEVAEAVQDVYLKQGRPIEPTPNPFATGFGARMGLTLPEDPLYIGAAFSYFVGGTSSLPASTLTTDSATAMPVVAPAVTHTVSVMLIGVEGGLDWDITDFLVVRPSLGLGLGMASSEVCIEGDTTIEDPNGPGGAANPSLINRGCQTASSTRVYYSPTLAVLIPLGGLFIGGEGRFTGLSGVGGAVSFYLGGTVGVSLQLFD